MSDATKPTMVVPNYRVPKTIGLLNIVFGSLILLMGVCSGLSMAVMPLLTRAMEESQKQLMARIEAQKQADLKAAKEMEENAKTEEERKAAEEDIRRIESKPAPPMPPGMDFRKMGMSDPKFLGYFYFDFVSMAVLNVLMIASGIGLTKFRPRARSLASWVAGIKIARLALMAALWCVLIVPLISRGVASMVADMFAQQQAMAGRGAPAGFPVYHQLARIYGVTYTVMGILGALGGMIYPAICLWFLSKPGVRAACAYPDLDPENRPPGAALAPVPKVTLPE